MNELTNHPQIALVTGAAGGIGRQLCIGLAEAGYRVIATDLAPHAFDHPEIHFHPLDLRDEQAIVRLFAEVREQHGGIHLLINNGAISKFHTRFEGLSAAQFDQVMTVNVRGAMLCARAFVQANRDLPYGRIINIASTRWQQNEPGWDAYGASKGALVALTQSLANSLADHPITVNAISPGWIQAEDYHTLTEADHRPPLPCPFFHRFCPAALALARPTGNNRHSTDPSSSRPLIDRPTHRVGGLFPLK